MNEIINEAIELIDELNSIYYDKTKNEEMIPFAFFYCAYYYGITYLTKDNFIWDSEDNDRNYLEKVNDYEPLRNCVLRRVKEYNKKLKNDMFK